MLRRSLGALVAAVSVLAGAGPAVAGYVTWLIRPFDIGTAQSLPWGAEWSRGRADYDLARLISDTVALLKPSTPIIVRLETLRRAVIYASADRRVAERLLLTFTERAHVAEQSERPDALAFLDAAFVTDALWQIGEHYNPPFAEPARQVHGMVGHADGYDLIRKGLALRPKDPAYEFGAALIVGVRHLGGAEFTEHARNAIVAAARDALLARNLDHIYAEQVVR